MDCAKDPPRSLGAMRSGWVAGFEIGLARGKSEEIQFVRTLNQRQAHPEVARQKAEGAGEDHRALVLTDNVLLRVHLCAAQQL
jgi:hypothetical protein